MVWLRLSEPNDDPRWRYLAGTAFCLAVGAWILALVYMSQVPLMGDERFYGRNAATLAALLTGAGPSLSEVARDVVGNGWFMPGITFAITPLYLLDSEPGVAVVRSYASVGVLLLWIWALREMATAFGRPGALALLIFPTFAVVWLLFTATLWADLPGGLLLAIVCARTYRLALDLYYGSPINFRQLLALELVMVAMVYMRGNTIVVVAAVHVFLLALTVLSGRSSNVLSRAGHIAAGLAVFCSLLAPWSLTASRILGGTVVTTSSTALAVGVTFGDTDELCFGPCPGRYVFYGAVRYSRTYAAEHDVSQLEAQRRMSAQALRDVTFSSYAQQVRRNFRSFALEPHEFAGRFARRHRGSLSPELRANLELTHSVLTLAVYVPFLLVLIVANLMVVRGSRHVQIQSLCVKLLTVSVFLQPFVHRSHGRYWVGYAPLMAVAAVMLFGWWRTVKGHPRALGVDIAEQRPAPSARVLTGLQTLYVLSITTVAAVFISA